MFSNNSTEVLPAKEEKINFDCMVQFKIVYHTFGGILAFLIIIMNLFVLTLFIRKSNLRKSPANYLLISLSINDLLSGVSILIHFIPYYHLNVNGCESTLERFSQSYFIMADISTLALLISAVAHLLLLSTERCISLLYALRYKLIITRTRVLIATSIAWFLGISLTVIQLAWIMPYLESPSYKTAERMVLIDSIYTKTLIICYAFIPAAILTVQYTWLFLLVRRLIKSLPKTKTPNKSLKEKKALIIYCSMFVCFLIFCVPYLTVKLLISVDETVAKSIPTELLECIFLLRFIISIINPLLYTLYKNDFRRAAKAILRVTSKQEKRGRASTFNSYPHLTEHTIDDRCNDSNNARWERHEMMLLTDHE